MFKFLVAHFSERRTRNRLRFVGNNPELRRDGYRGIYMVARNHNGTDTGCLTLDDSVLDFGADRVYHAREAEEGKSLFDILRLELFGHAFELLIRGGEHAQSPVRHLLIRGENLFALFVREGNILSSDTDVRAAFENFVGRSLGILYESSARGMNGGHHFPKAVEGRFGDALIFEIQFRLVEPQFIGIIDERTFRRLSLCLFRLRVEHGVRTLRHRACEQGFVVPVMVHDGHFVLRESSGLVGTDNLRAAEGFDGGEPFDYGLFLRHFGHPHGKDDGDDGRKSFGNGGDGERDRDDKAVEDDFECEISFENELKREDEHTDTEHDIAQNLRQFIEAFLQRSDLVLSLSENIGDLAHFRLHAGRHDDDLCAAVYDGAAHVDHIFSVAQGDVLAVLGHELFGLFVCGDALARQSGFFRLQGSAFEDAAISGDGISGFEDDDIPDDDFLALYGEELTAADYLAGGSRHFFERFYGVLGAPLLNDAENGVEKHDGDDDDKFCKGFISPSHAVDDDGGEIDSRGRQKDDDHRVDELQKETLEHRGLFALRQLVSAVFFESGSRFFCGQTVGRSPDFF